MSMRVLRCSAAEVPFGHSADGSAADGNHLAGAGKMVFGVLAVDRAGGASPVDGVLEVASGVVALPRVDLRPAGLDGEVGLGGRDLRFPRIAVPRDQITSVAREVPVLPGASNKD